MTDVIDIKTKKPLEKIEVDNETSVSRFLDVIKKICKKNDVKSVLIVMVDKDDHVDWGVKSENDFHLLLMDKCLEPIKREIEDLVVPSAEVDLDD